MKKIIPMLLMILTSACAGDPFEVGFDDVGGEAGEGGDAPVAAAGSASGGSSGAPVKPTGGSAGSVSHGGGSGSSGGEPTAAGAGGEGGAPEPTSTPRSCGDWQSSGVSTDGVQLIDPDGSGPVKPFKVYCADMATDPKAYLELAHTGETGWPGMNLGTSKDPNCSCGEDVAVSFGRVLLRSGDLTILSEDARYRDNGACEDVRTDECWGAYMNFGEARDCLGEEPRTGKFEIDLRGTPFHIAPGAVFEAIGFDATGYAEISPDGKRATVGGGGFCGGFGPKGGELPLEQDR